MEIMVNIFFLILRCWGCQPWQLQVFHFEEFRTFGKEWPPSVLAGSFLAVLRLVRRTKDSVRALPLTALAYDGSFTRQNHQVDG